MNVTLKTTNRPRQGATFRTHSHLPTPHPKCGPLLTYVTYGCGLGSEAVGRGCRGVSGGCFRIQNAEGKAGCVETQGPALCHLRKFDGIVPLPLSGASVAAQRMRGLWVELGRGWGRQSSWLQSSVVLDVRLCYCFTYSGT